MIMLFSFYVEKCRDNMYLTVHSHSIKALIQSYSISDKQSTIVPSSVPQRKPQQVQSRRLSLSDNSLSDTQSANNGPT